MDQLKNVWVVAAQQDTALELTSGANLLGERVSLLFAGDKTLAVNADIAYYLGEINANRSFLSYIPTAVRLVLEHKPDLVLVELSKNGRIAAAQIAAACNTSVLTDATDVWAEDGTVFSRRMVYGGKAVKTESAAGTAVVCVCAGVFDVRMEKAPKEVVTAEAEETEGLRLEGVKEKTVQRINLGTAKKVVSVGRGIGSPENIPLIEEFARLFGAELACSRPVAEEEKWLPAERFVGLSGQQIKPDMYVTVGISGQIQHLAGVTKAGLILAVNKDANAPIFKRCDYGIVGDYGKVIPALIEKFRK